VKIFRSEGDQAVRIPPEFELTGEEAIMHRDGEKLVIEPAARKSLLAVLASLPSIDENFPEIDDLSRPN